MQRCIKRSTGSLWYILPDEPASDSFIMRARQSRPSGGIITGADAEFNAFFTALAERLQTQLRPGTGKVIIRVEIMHDSWQKDLSFC